MRPVAKLNSIVLVAVLALTFAGHAYGQFGRRSVIEDNDPPATEFITQRWHFGTNGAIGHMGWSHNYPDSEINLNEFIGRTTRVDVQDASYRLLELSSPEIFDYPFAYISEPGEMELTEPEVANLREYIERGGFILIDDFDTWHMDNLREEMQRVFPDRVFERLSVDNPGSSTRKVRSRSWRATTTIWRISGSGTAVRSIRCGRPRTLFA
jgi:zona occludens toxin (predicted ATPase)